MTEPSKNGVAIKRVVEALAIAAFSAGIVIYATVDVLKEKTLHLKETQEKNVGAIRAIEARMNADHLATAKALATQEERIRNLEVDRLNHLKNHRP